MATTVRVRLTGDTVVVPVRLDPPFEDVTAGLRVLTPGEAADHRERAAKARGGEAVAVEARMLAGCIKEWNLVDDAGHPHPVTPEVIGRLPEPLLELLGLAAAGRYGVDLVGKFEPPSPSPSTTPAG